MGGLGFATDVEGFGRGKLHAKRQFERFDSRLQCTVGSRTVQLKAVHPLQEFELSPLAATRQAGVADVSDHPFRVQLVRVNEGSRVNTGQKAAAPSSWAGTGMPVVADHHEGWKVLVLGAEPIAEP